MEKIGKYQVVRKLGEGATSEVYLCHDPFASRDVAIKVVFPDSLGDDENRNLFRKLFITEASLAGKLTHPHIVQIYDAVVDEGISYVVMEYVDGGTLEPHCNANALLPVDKIVEIIFKCTRALDFANRAGVIHRDIKPANILLHGETDIKISDFGSALITTSMATQVSGHRLSRLYVAATDQGASAHAADRYLFARRGDVPAADRSAAVSGEQQFQHDVPDHQRRAAAAIEPAPGNPARGGPHRAQSDAKGAGAALPRLGRVLRRPGRGHQQRTGARSKDEFADSEKFNILRGLPFFANFGDAELWEVMRISSWEYCKPGKALMFDGQTGDFFCLLASGEVKVIKRGKLLNILNAGECFGEMAYISRETGSVRSADVVALSESRVITIHNEDLDRASDICRHKFDRAFMAILVDRLSLANTRLIGV